jgi:predicted PurR-regulated permease PerM
MRAGVSRDADSELPEARTVALWGIFVLLLLAALYAARSLALPVVLAALASLVLGPVVRALVRIRVPAPLAAAGLLLLLLGGTGYGLVALAGPATEWVKGAPEGAREIERKLRFLRDPVAKVSQATEQVERATRLPGAQPTQTVIVQPRRFSDVVLDQTQGFASGLFVSAVLLFFLLSSPDGFLE